jgi:hypothetical protein
MTKKRETVGKIALELMQQEAPTQDPIALERAMHAEYESSIWECVASAKKSMHGNFYVIVITKRERLLPNVFRNYFFARSTCPTPDYDQTVYLYNSKQDYLDFIWVIPSRDASHYLKNNALHVVNEERQLLQFVLDFADGTLYKLAKKLNGETLDSPLLVN